MWYRSSEQPLRLESYYCTNGIATMFGGLVGFGVGHITSGLPQWMYVFLIFGTVSIVAGVWSLLILPDSPSTCKFLTERERAVAVERVAENRQGVKNHHFKKYQMWQTFRDPKTWILFIMAVRLYRSWTCCSDTAISYARSHTKREESSVILTAKRTSPLLPFWDANIAL